jgi:hypothetical protein
MEAISVIIPTYNRASLVPRAIRSALAATSPGDEIIVVDDGSVDDTAAVMAQFGERVRYVRIENRGVGGARNHGVKVATNPLVAFLDSDDEWFPDKLTLQRKFMALRPDVLFCFSDFAMVDDDSGTQQRMYLRNWHGIERPWDEILAPGVPYSTITALPSGREDFQVHIGNLYRPLIEGSLVAAWTSLIRRERAGAALHFQEGIRICEEWWCFGRLARLGSAAYFACETAWNHGHHGPRVTDANQYDQLTCRLQMTEQLWGSDEHFRREHGKLYDRVVASIHHQRAKWHLSRGWMREARADLTRARARLSLMFLLAVLPGPVASMFGALRRIALRIFRPGMMSIPLALSNFAMDLLEVAPAM